MYRGLWIRVCGGGEILIFLYSGSEGKSRIHAGSGIQAFYGVRTPGAHFYEKIFVIYWEATSFKCEEGAHPGAHFGGFKAYNL